MCTMIDFVHYGMEISLFVFMIFSCCYLCLPLFRSRLTIPILDSDQKTYFESQNLRLDSNAKYLAANNKHQKDRGNNNEHDNNSSSYSLISSYHYYNDIDHANNNTTTTTTASSNTSKEDLPFVSVTVPARNEQDHIEKCLLSLLSQDYPKF